jgi:phytoene dehydrogenase-like protein
MGYDREFDGVFVGGGHQSLVCAAYMANAGYDVLVLERDIDVGGGLSTVDVSGRGFRYNRHSINHFNITGTPWYRDLNLAAAGVEYVQPEHEFAQPLSDGSALVLSRDTDRTVENLARFSERDARQYERMNPVAEDLVENVYLPERFDEPLPAEERHRLLSESDRGRTFLDWTTESAFDLVTDWYETPELRTLLLFKLSIFGEPGEGVDNPSHKGGICRCFDGRHTYQVARGGSRMLALGLQQVIQQAGGTVLTNREVTGIDVENGRATGVTLRDGTSIGAKRFVASGVNPVLTFERFVGLGEVEESYASRVEEFAFTDWSLMGTHFALKEAPDYEAAEAVPEVNEALKYNIGLETLDDIEAAHEAVVAKDAPVAGFGGGSISMFDGTQAPDGHHTAYAWQVAPYDLHDDPAAWEAEAERCRDQVLDTWREYAPNMTEDNVVHSHTYTPQQIPLTNPNMTNGGIFAGALTEDQTLSNHFGYRTPVEGLFLCGSSVHPGGAINGGAGYVAAKVIHESLGVDPWWDPVDARASLEALE